jgi:hypothetical protein
MKMRNLYLTVLINCAAVMTLFAQSAPGDTGYGRGRTYVATNAGSETVTLDGEQNEFFWGNAPFAGVDNFVGGAVLTPTATDVTAKFKVAFDALNFYVFANVVDDAKVFVNKSSQADNIEFFINTDTLWYQNPVNDGDGGRGPYRKSYTASLVRANPGFSEISGIGYITREESKKENYAYGYKETAEGWDVEMRIPFELVIPTNNPVVNITTTLGSRIPFEMNIGDADDALLSTPRETIGAWNSMTADAWKDVREFGWLVLGEKPLSAANLSDNQFLAEVYPTIADDYVNIKLSDYEKISSIRILNLLGQEEIIITKIEMDNKIQISKLGKGIFLVAIEKENGRPEILKFVKK